MSITVKQAADSVGMSKAAIFKAIRTGKISAEKNGNGEWQIQPAELFRVFEPVHSIHSNGHSEVQESTQPVHGPSVETLQMTVIQLEIRLQEMTAAKDDVINDLRQRLDASQAQVSQMGQVIAQFQPPQAKKGWWQRLLGGQ